MPFRQTIRYLAARAKERSTWNGIAATLSGCGIAVKPELWLEIVTVGTALAGLANMLLPETPANPPQPGAST